jgi:AAA15 family ATPase/GTPase
LPYVEIDFNRIIDDLIKAMDEKSRFMKGKKLCIVIDDLERSNIEHNKLFSFISKFSLNDKQKNNIKVFCI